jgi:Tat protein translocase TatB subunit
MFGIGYQEMFLILVVALVIFGPGKLPEVAGQVGRAVRDFRRMTADLTGEFEKTIAEVDDVKQSVRKEFSSMRAEVESVTTSVREDLEDLADTKGVVASATAKGAGGRVVSASKTVVGAEGGDASAPVMATKADPLADVSLLDVESVNAGENGQSQVDTDIGRMATASEPATATIAEAVSTGDADGAATGDDTSAEENAVQNPEMVVVANGHNGEAIARARRRRATAGYGRRS